MKSRRKFNVEFKKKVVEEVKAGALSTAQAIRQYELSSYLLHRWTNQYEHGKLENKPSPQGALENKIAELERKVGQQAMEIDLFKKSQGPLSKRSKREIIRSHPHGSILRRCQIMKIPRSTYYYECKEKDQKNLLTEIEAVVMEWPRYGYRRITKELKRRGTHVNHKVIQDLMRQNGLGCR